MEIQEQRTAKQNGGNTSTCSPLRGRDPWVQRYLLIVRMGGVQDTHRHSPTHIRLAKRRKDGCMSKTERAQRPTNISWTTWMPSKKSVGKRPMHSGKGWKGRSNTLVISKPIEAGALWSNPGPPTCRERKKKPSHTQPKEKKHGVLTEGSHGKCMVRRVLQLREHSASFYTHENKQMPTGEKESLGKGGEKEQKMGGKSAQRTWSRTLFASREHLRWARGRSGCAS